MRTIPEFNNMCIPRIDLPGKVYGLVHCILLHLNQTNLHYQLRRVQIFGFHLSTYYEQPKILLLFMPPDSSLGKRFVFDEDGDGDADTVGNIFYIKC